MNYYQLFNFLSTEDYLDLLRSAIDLESAFVPTTTSTNETDYRKSKVLYSLPPITKVLLDRILETYPIALHKLALEPFELGQVECQLTAHNDGHYYKIHNDDGSPEVVDRVLSYVYYFNSMPAAFSGGELKIYGDSNNETIEPINNSIVFFPSRLMHEVLTVSCPSQKFVDGRFTVNGWLRRK